MAKQTMMSWSTGKDSALATWRLINDPAINLSGLFCTINRTFSRTTMHAVRTELLEVQASRMGMHLDVIGIPYPCSNEEYEKAMGEFVDSALARDVQCFGFGDLYLEDIRDYRIDKLAGCGIEPVFPIWSRDTPALAREVIDCGIKAIITCVDPKQLDAEFAGREFNGEFLDDLPDHVDPCGENGEFHTFVFDAPMFSTPIPVVRGPVVERDGFIFSDLMHDEP